MGTSFQSPLPSLHMSPGAFTQLLPVRESAGGLRRVGAEQQGDASVLASEIRKIRLQNQEVRGS